MRLEALQFSSSNKRYSIIRVGGRVSLQDCAPQYLFFIFSCPPLDPLVPKAPVDTLPRTPAQDPRPPDHPKFRSLFSSSPPEISLFVLSLGGLKCCSMRMIFDPLYKLLNLEMFSFLHCNWHSEINVVFLLLIHRDRSHRTCLIIFNMFRCQHTSFYGFVSPSSLDL